jgi:hypothetical protein
MTTTSSTAIFDRTISDLQNLLEILKEESHGTLLDPPFLTEADQRRELAVAAIHTLLPTLPEARASRARPSRPLMYPPYCEHCD